LKAEEAEVLLLTLRRGTWWFQNWLSGWLIAAGFRVLEDIDSNEQWATGTRQGITVCWLAMTRPWSRRRKLCLAELKCMISWSQLQGTVWHYLFYWIFMVIQMTCLQFKRKFLLKLACVCDRMFL
jgi:hypothetical protein